MSNGESELSPKEYAVLRKAATEAAFTGEYTDNHKRRHLLVPGLRRGAVPVRDQVRQPLRLAVVLHPAGR